MKFMGQSEVRHQLLEYVEKQEPKKWIVGISSEEYQSYDCPVCEDGYSAHKDAQVQNYCHNCGQRLV